MSALLDAIPSKRDYAIFLIAYRHGMHASEMGMLRREDLDLKQYRIRIHRLWPYVLRAAKKFGFLVDFRFRRGENNKFSRRVRQLSLNLDKGFKRNLDYYLDPIA